MPIAVPEAAGGEVSTAPLVENDLKYPFAAQQHGFNDGNNSFREVTSHPEELGQGMVGDVGGIDRLP